MVIKQIHKLSLITLCGGLTAVAAHGLTGEGDPVQYQQQNRAAEAESPQARFEAAQAELQQIAAVLNPIQQQAQALPEVQKALLSYDAALIAEMKSINPEAREAIEQRGELFEALITAGDPAELDSEAAMEFQTNAQTFQEVRSTLSEVEMAAQNGEAVREQLVEYQETFLTAVAEIDPRATQMIQRQEELHRTLSEIQAEVMRN